MGIGKNMFNLTSKIKKIVLTILGILLVVIIGGYFAPNETNCLYYAGENHCMTNSEYEELKNNSIRHYIENKDSEVVFEGFQDLQIFLAILNKEMSKTRLENITPDQIISKLVSETFE